MFLNDFHYHNGGAGELILMFSGKRNCKLYLAHVIEQPNFRIPNPQYLQRNSLSDIIK